MITLAWTTVALHGRAQALDLLDQVRALNDSPRLHALSHVQEAVVHVSLADWREALDALGRIDPAAFDLLTPREQTSALLNGGLSHLSLLELDAARGELQRALDLAVTHRVPEQEFKARHNLGCLEFYSGHLPEAIRLMRTADELDAPVARARARQDLAQVLLEAGLLDQARDTLAGALGEARSERLSLEEADIRLDLAACALVEDDASGARRELGAAIRIYRSRGARGRQHSTALLRAAVEVSHGRVPRDVQSVLDPWSTSARPVTPEERLAARVRVEALLLSGDVDGAADAVQRLRGRARQGVAADMHDRLLVAKVAAAKGDSRAARRAVHTALHRLTARQVPTQSLEIRAALALHGRRLSEFDLGDALATGSARRVFDSVERWRAVSHRLPPLVASVDSATAELMAELRQARRLLAAEPTSDVETQRLRGRVAQLEWRIAQRDWSAAEKDHGVRVAGAATLGPTRQSLGARDEQALVLFSHAGQQYLLTVGAGAPSVHHLGPVQDIVALSNRLLRDLRAHAYAAVHPVMEQALARAVGVSVADLDRALFQGIELEPDRGVVVAPGRSLASVPWGALPSLGGRPVTVATSMTRWAAPRSTGRGPLTAATLVGPGLRRAAEEAELVSAAWGVVAAPGEQGRDSQALKTALASNTVVHVAAHGTHERQSPYFSSLHLDDGPVFAHELPRPVASSHVVLSACDVGQSDLRPGDEPLGLTAALLALGVDSVVAAVSPVADDVAAAAMVDYHGRLARGIPAARALAETVVRHPGARSFCLYGADWAAPLGAAAAARDAG
jgi:tetratricopeptide (TPR) repeat protein